MGCVKFGVIFRLNATIILLFTHTEGTRRLRCSCTFGTDGTGAAVPWYRRCTVHHGTGLRPVPPVRVQALRAYRHAGTRCAPVPCVLWAFALLVSARLSRPTDPELLRGYVGAVQVCSDLCGCGAECWVWFGCGWSGRALGAAGGDSGAAAASSRDRSGTGSGAPAGGLSGALEPTHPRRARSAPFGIVRQRRRFISTYGCTLLPTRLGLSRSLR